MIRKTAQVLTLVLTAAACGPGKPPENLDPQIRQVETSLIPPVRIEGDSIWTIEERMKHYGVPGVSIAVIQDNKIIWSKAYGIMDKESKEPVTTQTLFQAGSISKPVSAFGALKFAAMGKIDADENINTYLKSWQLPENEFTKGSKVSLKHLLSHTGGVTVHGFLGYSPNLPVPTLVQILNGETPANSPPIRIDKLPGADFRYSGGGYCIMQQMLIDIDRKPFPQIMQEQVLGPLGMTSSTYDQPLSKEKLPLAATGYVPDGTMTKGKRHTYPEMAAAGLWTTAEDLARFAIEIQLSSKGESNKVLSREQVNEMLTPYISKEVGLGIFVDVLKSDVYFGHGGWDEGFSSAMTAHRDKGYGVVVLTNSNHPPFIDELIRAVALTYKWSDFMPIYKPVPMDAETIQRVVGRYKYDSDGVSEVVAKGDKLFYQYTGMKPMEMFKVSDSTFARSERTALIQFKANPVDGQLHLVFRSDLADSVKYEHPLMKTGEKIPYEWFLAGDYVRAQKEYQLFMKSNPDDKFINEEAINRRGYDLMNESKFQMAKELFRINMGIFPMSANAYDSYAEACMKNGDKKEAIENYRKSLKMNPDNPGAKKNLETLEEK